jgi:hypothetical protein
LRRKAEGKTTANRQIAVIRASLVLTRPEAIGLYFLTGCCLSFLMSITSFKRYMPLDRKQKIIKTNNVFKNILGCSRFLENSSAEKTSRFFIQLFTLNEISRFLIMDILEFIFIL